MRRLALPLPIGCKGEINQDYMSAKKVAKVNKKPKYVSKTPRKPRPDVSIRNKGNDWWNLRSKHGRDKLFASPQLLWEAACEYFQWCLDNPNKRGEIVKYEGWANVVDVKTRTPFTREGLCLYLDASTSYFREFKRTCNDKDFLTVIDKIEDTIQRQQFDGVLSGEYPGQIVSQYLGLVTKQDVTTGGERLQTTMPELTIKIENNTPGFANAEAEVKDKKK